MEEDVPPQLTQKDQSQVNEAECCLEYKEPGAHRKMAYIL